MFDEMKVREDLIFDKHSCRLVGFVNKFRRSMIALNKLEKLQEQPITEDSVATHMLAFVIIYQY